MITSGLKSSNGTPTKPFFMSFRAKADGGTNFGFHDRGISLGLSVAMYQSRSVAAGDLDRDNVMDFVSPDTGGTTVYRGTGDGFFSVPCPPARRSPILEPSPFMPWHAAHFCS